MATRSAEAVIDRAERRVRFWLGSIAARFGLDNARGPRRCGEQSAQAAAALCLRGGESVESLPDHRPPRGQQAKAVGAPTREGAAGLADDGVLSLCIVAESAYRCPNPARGQSSIARGQGLRLWHPAAMRRLAWGVTG